LRLFNASYFLLARYVLYYNVLAIVALLLGQGYLQFIIKLSPC